MELFEGSEGSVKMPQRQDFFLGTKEGDPGLSMSIYEKRLRKAALKKAGVSIHKIVLLSIVEDCNRQ